MSFRVERNIYGKITKGNLRFNKFCPICERYWTTIGSYFTCDNWCDVHHICRHKFVWFWVGNLYFCVGGIKVEWHHNRTSILSPISTIKLIKLARLACPLHYNYEDASICVVCPHFSFPFFFLNFNIFDSVM